MSTAAIALPASAASASVPVSARYDVQLQGNVNGIGFSRVGGLAIFPTVSPQTTNGVNPVELCIASGSPFISPETGALWFATNGYCVNTSGARQDMAFVATGADSVAIRPDPGISATGINGFNQNSGLLANVYQIFDGSMRIDFPGNGSTISGSIDFLGTGSLYHSEQRYQATFTGQARQLTPSAPAPKAPVSTSNVITRDKSRQRVGRSRIASIATVFCPTGICRVGAPKSVSFAIGGRRYRASVLAPKLLAGGKRAHVRVKLSRAAFSRLAGRKAKIKLKLTISVQGRRVARTVVVTLSRRS